MIRRALLIVSLFLFVGAARADDLRPILGPLADEVSTDTSGAWTASVANGAFVLQAQESGVVRFYRTPWAGDRKKGRSVGVRVRSQGSGGGLVFGVASKDGEEPRWIAFTVDGDGKLMVRVRTATEARTAFSGGAPGGRRSGGDLLQLSETGDSLELFANGAKVWTMPTPTDARVLDAPVGIIAVGPGQFAFNAFAFAGPVAEDGTDDRLPPTGVGDDRLPAPKSDKMDLSKLTDQQIDTVGAIFSILFHEYGHFMNNELKLPVTGPEEDVADEFSAMVWNENVKLDPAAARLALGGAKLWLYMAEEVEAHKGSEPPWYDEHAPDMRRFGAYICDLYGANPNIFAPVMNAAKVPQARQQSCVQQWSHRRAAWVDQLRAHRRKGEDPDFPGDLPADAKGGRITVEWQPSKTEIGEQLRIALSQSGGFERLTKMVSDLYVLPRDAKLVFRDCDTVNCWYNPTDGSVTMCYEMIVFAIKLMEKYDSATAQASTQPQPSPQPQPQPQPSSSPQTQTQDDSRAFLVGAWHSIQQENNMRSELLTIFRQDGTFRASDHVTMPGLDRVLEAKGLWTVTSNGQGRLSIAMRPTEWKPRQICMKGSCSPLPMKEDVSDVEIVDHDTLHGKHGESHRVQ